MEQAAVVSRHKPRHVRGSWLSLVFSLTVCLLAGGRLTSRSLNNDEAFSLALAREPWGSLWHITSTNQLNMAPYHAALKLWVLLFGSSEVAIRSLSVLCAAASAAIMFVVARRLFTVDVACVATALLVLSGFFLYYAQEVRAYALVVLLTAAGTWLLIEFLDRGSLRMALAYALVMSLGTYALFHVGLVVVAHALVVPRHPAFRTRRLASVVAFGAFAFLSLPVLLFAATRDAGQIDWLQAPGFKEAATVARVYAGSAPLLSVAVLLALAALGLLLWAGSAIRSRTLPWPSTLVVGGFAVPLLIAVAVTFTVKPIIIARYLIPTLPMFTLLLGDTVLRAGRRPLVACALLAVGATTVSFLSRDDPGGWRPVSQRVFDAAQPGDRIYFEGGFLRFPFDYYWSGQEWPQPIGVEWGAYSMRVSDPLRPCDQLRPGDRLWIVGKVPGCIVRRERLSVASIPGSTFRQAALFRVDEVRRDG